MASSRDQRRLQRLRGADTHLGANIDFDFNFPTAPVEQSTSPEPSTDRSSAQSTPKAAAGNQRQVVPPDAHTPSTRTPRASDSRSTLKRRRSTAANEPLSRQEPSGASIYDIDADEDQPEQEVVQLAPAQSDPTTEDETTPKAQSTSRLPRTASRPLPTSTPLSQVRFATPPPRNSVTEVAESPVNLPGSGSRRFVLSEKKKQSNASPSQQTTASRRSMTVPYPLLATRTPLAQQPVPSPELSGQTSGENFSDDLLPPIDDGLSGSSVDTVGESQVQQNPDTDEAEEISDAEATEWLKRKRRKVSVDIEDEEDDTLSVIENEQDWSPIARPQAPARREYVASPAEQRQPKRVKRTERRGDRDRSPLSFTVHRLTEAPKYATNERDAEVLNAEIPYRKHGDINAVDVFTHMCEEVVNQSCDEIAEQAEHLTTAEGRKEARAKVKALEAFLDDMKTRLMELRIADAQEQKIQLREELLALRRAREKTAVQLDELRTKAERSAKEAEKIQSLQTTFTDVDLAVSRGRQHRETRARATPVRAAAASAKVMQDLEFDLQLVAETLFGGRGGRGGGSGGGGSSATEAPPASAAPSSLPVSQAEGDARPAGLLHQVQRFNAFLERAAVALESGRGKRAGRSAASRG